MKYLYSFIFVLFFIIASPTLAVTSTSSGTLVEIPITKVPTPTVSDDSTIKENLETRIKNIVQQNLSTAEANLKEKINQQAVIGFAGKVKSITSTSMSIDSYGEMFQVVTTDTTVIMNGTQKVKLSSIAIGEKVIAIGVLSTKNNILDAKRIVVVKASTTPDVVPLVYAGKILSVDKTKMTLSLQIGTNTQKLIISKKANLKPEEFTLNSNVVVITRQQDAGMVISKAKIL